jgi:sugar (pentulose or hexulose) kinase
MNYFLGIDLGTSYFKAGIFDENGDLLGLGRHFVEKNSINGITCELSVDIFQRILRFCIDEAIEESGVSSRDISAVSYSSQANSFILLDKENKPLTPIILWPDNRVGELSVPLQTLISRDDFITITGLGIKPDSYSLMAKVDWFQKHQPQTWEKVDKIMSISDYLIFSLTGQFVSDTSTSSMTGLLNVQEGKWWQAAIDLFNIETNHLPIPLNPGAFVGHLTGKGAEMLGLSSDTLLFTGGLDQHMVVIGGGGIISNTICESTGTVLACVNYTNEYQPREGINVAPGPDINHFFQMAFNDNGALALEWYQKNYAGQLTITELLNLAERIEPGCNGLIAKPKAYVFPGLEGFINRTKEHRDAHFIRAILESTALSLSKLVKILEGDKLSGAIIPSGGGAKSRLWLQIKANIIDRPFWVPESVELACKGAAMFCLVGTSYFTSPEEATEKLVKFKLKINPQPAESEIYKMWTKNIETITYE